VEVVAVSPYFVSLYRIPIRGDATGWHPLSPNKATIP
jgi:hypothetical protein